MIVDLWLVYSFIKRLATPFNEWEAFKLGIIDERGNILRKRKDLRLQNERKAFGVFDVMVLNIKRLIEKLPGGQTRLASYAAALFLIREWKAFTPNSILTENVSDEQLIESLESFFVDSSIIPLIEAHVNEKDDLNNLFEQAFSEDAPTMSVGSGQIAGLGVGPDGEPGLSRSQQRKHANKNKKSGGKRLRDVISR
jgi:hypothetical protein